MDLSVSRVARAILAPLVLALGCQSAPPPPAQPPGPVAASDDVRGGSRLKANWVTGPEGVAMPSPDPEAPFYDSLLGVDCRFLRTGDGELRCVPGTYLLEYLNRKYFSDAGCTTELIPLAAGSDPGGFIQLQQDFTTCPGRLRRWELGPALPATAPVYMRLGGASCGAWVGLGIQFHPLAREVDASTLVKALQVDGESRSGFTEVRLIADDGAVQALGFKVGGTGPLVQPRVAADGTWRLLSVDPSDATLKRLSPAYSDQTCTTPVAVADGSCTAVGPYALGWATNPVGCGLVEAAYTVGARLDGVHDRTWGTCDPIVSGTTGFAVGAEIPASTFPATPPVATSGRLVRPTFAVGEGWIWQAARVLDTSTGVSLAPDSSGDCVERWLPTSEHRGVTSGEIGMRAFADAGCTVPLAFPPRPGLCEANTWYFAEPGWPACGANRYPTRFYAHGPRHVGQTWERSSLSGPCLPSTSTASVYAIGPEIPASDFAPVGLERR